MPRVRKRRTKHHQAAAGKSDNAPVAAPIDASADSGWTSAPTFKKKDKRAFKREMFRSRLMLPGDIGTPRSAGEETFSDDDQEMKAVNRDAAADASKNAMGDDDTVFAKTTFKPQFSFSIPESKVAEVQQAAAKSGGAAAAFSSKKRSKAQARRNRARKLATAGQESKESLQEIYRRITDPSFDVADSKKNANSHSASSAGRPVHHSQRKKIVKQGQDRLASVLSNPAFAANPLVALRAHLEYEQKQADNGTASSKSQASLHGATNPAAPFSFSPLAATSKSAAESKSARSGEKDAKMSAAAGTSAKKKSTRRKKKLQATKRKSSASAKPSPTARKPKPSQAAPKPKKKKKNSAPDVATSMTDVATAPDGGGVQQQKKKKNQAAAAAPSKKKHNTPAKRKNNKSKKRSKSKKRGAKKNSNTRKKQL